MKKYSFSLENVLKHRQIIEDQSKREFALALKTLQECETNLAATEAKIKLKADELASIEKDRVFSSSLFMEYQNYIQRLQWEKRNQERRIINARQEVEQKRAVLIEASRNKKVLLRLKEIDIKKYNMLMNRLEQNFIDETAVMSYVGKKRDGEQ